MFSELRFNTNFSVMGGVLKNRGQPKELVCFYVLLIETNLSAGKDPRASFMTLMTSSPTCLAISGLTSLKTSSEFSFKNELTVSPIFDIIRLIRYNHWSLNRICSMLPRIGSPLNRLFNRMRIFPTFKSRKLLVTWRFWLGGFPFNIKLLVASTVTLSVVWRLSCLLASVNIRTRPELMNGNQKSYSKYSKKSRNLPQLIRRSCRKFYTGRWYATRG